MNKHNTTQQSASRTAAKKSQVRRQEQKTQQAAQLPNPNSNPASTQAQQQERDEQPCQLAQTHASASRSALCSWADARCAGVGVFRAFPCLILSKQASTLSGSWARGVRSCELSLSKADLTARTLAGRRTDRPFMTLRSICAVLWVFAWEPSRQGGGERWRWRWSVWLCSSAEEALCDLDL
jgi:hypothetical protein